MPVMVERDGDLVAVSGSMGGGGQPQINAQTLMRTLDLGLRADGSVAAPRWLVGGMDLAGGRAVHAEARVPKHVREALERTGFPVTVLGDVDEGVGHAQLIVRKRNGAFDVGSDPRADGEAAAG
jgi:gamma-glutamyltranspeptidase